MPTLLKSLSGTGFFARVARGSAFTASGYAASQLLRLLANLLLTRILYPEAFGLMALVSVFMVGLVMFSDVGIGPAISQNRRGDDPDFLDTAWSIQVIRGVLMFLAAAVLAFPVAWFYDAPMLAQLLPVASLTLVIAGFYPTRIETANRHLMLGRVTLLDLASQAVGTLSMLVIAWQTQSVWALVVGGLFGALAGGPIGAAVGAVANAVLDKPMQGLGAKTYRVTGPWVEPKIEVIERDAAAPTPRKP